MYSKFFGVQKNPFAVSPDADCLYASPQYRDALAGLSYGLLERKGFLMITGDAGLGKTTLCRRLSERLPADRLHSALVTNPAVPPEELLELLLWSFGFQDIPSSKVGRWALVNRFLNDCREKNQIAALIIDEAHLMPAPTLEEVRMLGNLVHDATPMLQILLAGQSQLNVLMNEPRLRQFKQRIAIKVSLNPLTEAEVTEYIDYRWRRAGASSQSPFLPEAVNRIATLSQGIPRVVNTLCDNTLMIAFAEGRASATAAHANEAARDLGISEPAPPAPKTVQVPKPVAAVAAVNGGISSIPRFEHREFGLQTLTRYTPVRVPFLTRIGRKLGFVQT